MTTQAARDRSSKVRSRESWPRERSFPSRPTPERHQDHAGSPQPARRAAASAHHSDLNQLMVELLPLVKRVAFQIREHLPAHVDMNDLVGAGALGLIDAVRKFDPRKHVKLESYARYRIRGAILDGLRGLDTASRDMRNKSKQAQRVYRNLESKLGRPVSDDEMAQGLGVSLKKWYRTVHELQPVGVDWLRPRECPEIQSTNEETLAASGDQNAFDQCYRREQRDLLNRALSCLGERDRLMMSLYYEHDMTMKEIGEKLGVDESRVSQLHAAALRRLRARVKALLGQPRAGAPEACVVAALESQNLKLETANRVSTR